MDDPLIPPPPTHRALLSLHVSPGSASTAGAIRFVLSGAALMAPGLTSAEGKLPDIETGERELEEGEVVVVVEAEGEGGGVCMVGRLEMGTEEMRAKKKGVRCGCGALSWGWVVEVGC